MNSSLSIPSFDEHFPELNNFIHELVEQYQAGNVNNWDDLDSRVNAFFTAQRMEQTESTLPHWKKMASYLNGVTLVHVMCVFLGLHMLPEYKNMTREQQNLMKWIVLFHDIEKEVEKGKRDHLHAFRSAVNTAKLLPYFGFKVTDQYGNLFDGWSELTLSANIKPGHRDEAIPDNHSLHDILAGIDGMFGTESPAGHIVKAVLLHMSITVVTDWPQAAPLRDEEVSTYISRDLLPLLKAMMLADNEGWVMFYPEDRRIQREETLATYKRLETRIH